MAIRDLTLVCTGRRRETDDVVTFAFRAEDHATIDHLPGQALALAVPLDAEPAWRSFTIASAPGGEVELTVKANGVATRWMHERLRAGTVLAARGPSGRFSLALHHALRFALISGGSGATPMMSMLRWLARRGETVDVVYVHAAHAPDDLLFVEELARIDAELPDLRVALVVSTVPPGRAWSGYAGRVDRRMLATIVPDLARREVFCCGPDGFTATVRRIFSAEGGDTARFHTESFGPPRAATEATVPPPAAAPTAADTVTVTIDGHRASARRGDLLVAAARAAGVVIPTGCGQGVCGTCRVRLVAGEVDMTQHGGLTPREERLGLRLACCSRLTGPVEVERIGGGGA